MFFHVAVVLGKSGEMGYAGASQMTRSEGQWWQFFCSFVDRFFYGMQ